MVGDIGDGEFGSMNWEFLKGQDIGAYASCRQI
jgi:hypothetical protein